MGRLSEAAIYGADQAKKMGRGYEPPVPAEKKCKRGFVTWKGKEWNGMTQWIARGQLIKTAPEVVKAWEAKGKRKGTKRKAPANASSQGRRPRRAPPPPPPRRNPARQAAAPAVESDGSDEEDSEDSGDEVVQGGQLDACDLLGI